MVHTQIVADRPWFEIGCTLGEGALSPLLQQL